MRTWSIRITPDENPKEESNKCNEKKKKLGQKEKKGRKLLPKFAEWEESANLIGEE